LAVAAIASRLGLTPDFPAYAGEDDFSLRFGVFLLGVVPSFMALGAAVGFLATVHGYSWLRSTVGGVAGTTLTLLSGRLLAPVIERLSSRNLANGAVVAFFVGWVVLSLVGVLVAGRLRFAGGAR
jgi:hypothetical protein